MLGCPHSTLLDGHFDAMLKAILLGTLPRDCSLKMSIVRLILAPQRAGMATSVAGTYRERQAKLMGKKAARDLLCSPW